MAESAGQPRHARAVDERRPQELEGVDQRGQAEEPDDLERQAHVAEPRRQCVENEQAGQARGEAERHHHERRPLGVDGQRLARAPHRSTGVGL